MRVFHPAGRINMLIYNHALEAVKDKLENNKLLETDDRDLRYVLDNIPAIIAAFSLYKGKIDSLIPLHVLCPQGCNQQKAHKRPPARKKRARH